MWSHRVWTICLCLWSIMCVRFINIVACRCLFVFIAIWYATVNILINQCLLESCRTEVTTDFCKWPDSKYSRLCGLYDFSTTIHLWLFIMKAALDNEWLWLRPNSLRKRWWAGLGLRAALEYLDRVQFGTIMSKAVWFLIHVYWFIY